ncbi:hypothetical protein ACOSQ3_033102 [Xanthoceras sorbifolium]
MFYKSTGARHDFFRNSTFEFLFRPPDGDKRYCDGCGKPVKGFVYHCRKKGWDLHPCRMNLPNKLKVKDVKFRLHDKVLKKCFWCNRRRLEGSVSGIRGWSYVSKCDKYHFHVNCATEMAHEGWRNESYSNNNNNNHSNSLALALENLELPIRGRLRRDGGGRGSKVTRIVNRPGGGPGRSPWASLSSGAPSAQIFSNFIFSLVTISSPIILFQAQ